MMASGPGEGMPGGMSLPLRSGAMVVVVGPSGAGKDTLLHLAGAQFAAAAGVLFVRRAITRPDDGGGEGHRPMTPAEFAAARRSGCFALNWRAHGLCYGIPASVDAHVSSGKVAVANGSRAALPLFAARYFNLMVVHVWAPPEILAARLAARGRESRVAILERIRRAGDAGTAILPAGAVSIENSGEPEAAAALLVAQIRKAIAIATASGAG